MNSNSTSYTIEQAVNAMQNYTRKGESFSIKFAKVSGGTSFIADASLRKMAKTSQDKNGAYKLQLVDTTNDSFKSCWIPLIMEFNGNKINA